MVYLGTRCLKFTVFTCLRDLYFGLNLGFEGVLIGGFRFVGFPTESFGDFRLLRKVDGLLND